MPVKLYFAEKHEKTDECAEESTKKYCMSVRNVSFITPEITFNFNHFLRYFKLIETVALNLHQRYSVRCILFIFICSRQEQFIS